MTRKQHLRRIAILCLYCLRHMAYYRAGWSSSETLIAHSQFWVAANGNFLDICVLEWCKLFGDKQGKHYWKKGVSDPIGFKSGLLEQLEMTDDEFNGYIDEMKTYRDKYVAHLDLNEKFDIPRLDISKKCVLYLYKYLLDREDEGGYFADGPRDAAQFFEIALKEGHVAYNVAYRNAAEK